MQRRAIHLSSQRWYRPLRNFFAKIALVLVLAGVTTLAVAQSAGIPDPAWVMSDTAPVVMTAFAVQPDGRIVATGYDPSDGNREFVTLRFNTDGTLDTSFGTQGSTTTPVGVQDAAAWGIAIAVDGSIYAAGSSTAAVDGVAGFAVIRYRADGSLDTTFAGDGSAEYTPEGFTGFAVGGVFEGRTLALQPDGKVLVAGAGIALANADTSSSSQVVVRFNADGSLDQSFGSNGQLILHPPETSSIGALRVATDGSIFIAGFGGPATQELGRLIKLTPEGALDTAFATDGVYTPVARQDVYHDLVVQADGKIVVVGQEIQGTPPNALVGVAVARLNADGSPDTAFANGGTRFVELGPRGDFGTSVAIDNAGRILVTGIVRSLGAFYNSTFLLRLTPTGSMDGSFGSGGIMTPAGRASFHLDIDAAAAVFLLSTEATLLTSFDASTFIQKILTDDPALPLLPRISSYSSAGAPRDSEFAIGVRGADSVLTEHARAGEMLAINGYIFPQDSDENYVADIFVVTVAPTGWFMRNLDGVFVPWNTRIADLMPAYERMQLLYPLPVELYNGALAIEGAYGLYLGYMRTDGEELVYAFSAVPLGITAP